MGKRFRRKRSFVILPSHLSHLNIYEDEGILFFYENWGKMFKIVAKKTVLRKHCLATLSFEKLNCLIERVHKLFCDLCISQDCKCAYNDIRFSNIPEHGNFPELFKININEGLSESNVILVTKSIANLPPHEITKIRIELNERILINELADKNKSTN